jgi:arginyl-tRNA--protein-N-Asp/Glu arginylyltransferase
MKTIPPPAQDFTIYIARPGTVFIERESGDSLTSIYGSGYLPYSGTKGLRNIFYSARSARIVLPEFELTSENRRIAKKFDGKFKREHVPYVQFRPDENFYNFCLDYFALKHGAAAMPRARLQTILDSGLLTNSVVYRNIEKPVAYVLEIVDGSMGHYWFSFYDLALAQQSLGLWLMFDCIRSAKAAGLRHYYLGTVYGEKALYKTNFEPLEWWDGKSWSKDIALLKELSRRE